MSGLADRRHPQLRRNGWRIGHFSRDRRDGLRGRKPKTLRSSRGCGRSRRRRGGSFRFAPARFVLAAAGLFTAGVRQRTGLMQTVSQRRIRPSKSTRAASSSATGMSTHQAGSQQASTSPCLWWRKIWARIAMLGVARTFWCFRGDRAVNPSSEVIRALLRSLYEPHVSELQTWMLAHPEADLSVPALANRMAMSERNFSRLFRSETGQTPAEFAERARADAARYKLEHTIHRSRRLRRNAALATPNECDARFSAFSTLVRPTIGRASDRR